jgi:hypothetical protein
MSTFVYSTQKDFDGPWLVSRDALNELDEVLERICGRYQIEADKHIETEINNHLEGYPQEIQDKLRESTRESFSRLKLQRNVKLTLSNAKYIQGETIKGLLANPELQEEAPTGVEVDISASNLNARLQLGGGSSEGASLNIRTSPETDNISREAFSELQLWATKNQSPSWQRLWNNVAPWNWFVWLVIVATSSIFLPSTSNNVEKYLNPIAKELLSEGISEAELPKAVELLLQYKSKHIPQGTRPDLPTWFGILVFGGLAVNIIFSIRPKIVIGIGRNENKLFLWRKWTKFVGVTIPTIVFGGFVWPNIVDWVKNAL